jgi:crossover junction endodeoxyribonuclease RuvC
VLILAIDPGLRGALAWLNTATGAASVKLMPLVPDRERDDYDEFELRKLIDRTQGLGLVVYEKLGSLPPTRADGKAMGGGIGNHRRGLACGIIRGLLASLPPGCQLAVPPQVWQRALLEGIPGADTKARSIWLARRLFPAVSLLPTPRSRKPHDGMADALCLAEFGRRTLAGDRGKQRGLLGVGA